MHTPTHPACLPAPSVPFPPSPAGTNYYEQQVVVVVLGTAASGAVSGCIHYEVLTTEVREIMVSLVLARTLVSCRSARAVPANGYSLPGA
jgi:hypothetical protein